MSRSVCDLRLGTRSPTKTRPYQEISANRVPSAGLDQPPCARKCHCRANQLLITNIGNLRTFDQIWMRFWVLSALIVPRTQKCNQLLTIANTLMPQQNVRNLSSGRTLFGFLSLEGIFFGEKRRCERFRARRERSQYVFFSDFRLTPSAHNLLRDFPKSLRVL